MGMSTGNFQRKCILLLAGTAFLVLFAGLGIQELGSGDETRVAGIAAEMFLEKEFLLPRLNGSPFLEYPPGYYWLTGAAFSLFGIHDFAAKLPSGLAAFGMVLLTYLFARKLKFSSREAFLSGIVLLFSGQFFAESRTCRVDMTLAFFLELSIFSFYAMIRSERRSGKIGYWLLFLLGLVCGCYTKGLLGLVLPGSVIAFWLPAEDLAARRFRWKRYIAACAGGLLAFGAAGIWYFLLLRREGYEMFHTAFWINNLGRFTGNQPDHAESFFYYLWKLPSLFQPWLLFLLLALATGVQRIRNGRNRELLFPLLALLIPFLLMCCASGKRIVYLLPLSVPAALLTGWYLQQLLEMVQKRWQETHLKRIGKVVLFTAIAVLLILDFGVAFFRNRNESLRPLFEKAAELERQGKKLFLVNPPERTRGAAYFYLHRTIPEKTSEIPAPPPNECWIIRRKEETKDSTVYADHHRLLEGRASGS